MIYSGLGIEYGGQMPRAGTRPAILCLEKQTARETATDTSRNSHVALELECIAAVVVGVINIAEWN